MTIKSASVTQFGMKQFLKGIENIGNSFRGMLWKIVERRNHSSKINELFESIDNVNLALINAISMIYSWLRNRIYLFKLRELDSRVVIVFPKRSTSPRRINNRAYEDSFSKNKSGSRANRHRRLVADLTPTSP